MYRFKRHLNHSSTNLWRIIEQGFYPDDPSNFTPREAVNHQFNEYTLFILQEAIPPKDIAHLRPFTVAKEAWEHVVSLYKGSASIQRSNFEVVQDESDEFAMNEPLSRSHSEIMGARIRMTIGSSASFSRP